MRTYFRDSILAASNTNGKGRPRQAACAVLALKRDRLLEDDRTEIGIGVTGNGGEEKLVLLAVECRSAAEFQPPQPVDNKVFAEGVLHGAQKLSRGEIVSIDGAGRGVV